MPKISDKIVGYTPWGQPIYEGETSQEVSERIGMSFGGAPPVNPNAGNGLSGGETEEQKAARLKAEQDAITAAWTAKDLASQIAARNAKAQSDLMNAQAALARVGADSANSLRDFQEKLREFNLTFPEGQRQFDLTLQEKAREFDTTETRERAAMILNAPKGPADAFTYLARMRALNAQGFVTDTLRAAMQNATGMSIDQLQNTPVLTNTQLATGLVGTLTGGALDPNTAGFLQRTFGTPAAATSQPPAETPQKAAVGAPGQTTAGPNGEVVENLQGGGAVVHHNDGWMTVYFANGKQQTVRDENISGNPNYKASESNGQMHGETPEQFQARTAAQQNGSYYGGGPLRSDQSSLVPGPSGQNLPFLVNSLTGTWSGLVPRTNVEAPWTGAAGNLQESKPLSYFTGGNSASGGTAMNPETGLNSGGSGGFLLSNPLGGYQTSAQQFGRLTPGGQAAYMNLIQESGGENPDDFLSEMRKGSLGFGPSRSAKFSMSGT